MKMSGIIAGGIVNITHRLLSKAIQAQFRLSFNTEEECVVLVKRRRAHASCSICQVQWGAVTMAIYSEMSQQSAGRQRGNLTGDLAARWLQTHCEGWERVT